MTQPHVPLSAFTPVPRKCNRHDGWTPERQAAFIEGLALTGSVHAAAKRVGMTTEGAYMLRRAPGSDSFRVAWAEALDAGVTRLEDLAIDRAINGVEVPMYSYGKLIGSRRVFNDRLLMFILRSRRHERYGNREKTPLSFADRMVARGAPATDRAALQKEQTRMLEAARAMLEGEYQDRRAREASQYDHAHLIAKVRASIEAFEAHQVAKENKSRRLARRAARKEAVVAAMRAATDDAV